VHSDTEILADSGYQGLKKLHTKTRTPKKRTKNAALTPEDKRANRLLASERVSNENVIAMVKRFKIVSDRYRNRRKRFGLRFNLIAGLYNWELSRS
jgi:DDE superfamily endonuclease